MPRLRASRGLENRTGSPMNRSSPPSAGNTPDRILISVDFPAPLSPNRATIRPDHALSDTSTSAVVGPKCLDRCCASRTGTGWDGTVGVDELLGAVMAVLFPGPHG